MIEQLGAGLAAHRGWRGWWFWQVTVIGGHNPAEVARTWTLADVADAAIDLMVKSLIEDL